MRLLLLAVGVWTGTLLIVWGGVRLVLRWRRRALLPDQPPVSPKWLNENVYRRTGDEP